MQLTDENIRSVLASSKEEATVSAPEWNTLSSNVRKQNFFKFGLAHFNIYVLAAALFISGGAIFYAITGEVSDSPQTQNIETNHKLEQEVNNHADKSNIETSHTTTTKGNTTESEDFIDKSIPEHKSSSLINENTSLPTNQPKQNTATPLIGKKGIDKSSTISSQPEAGDEMNNRNQNLSAEEEKTNIQPNKKQISGTKKIIFATDTVVEVDTVTVTKKKRRR